MFRSAYSLSVISLAVLVTACGQSTDTEWKKNQDIGMGVSLSYPSSFVAESVSDTEVANGTGTLRLQKVRLRRGEGSLGTIMMMRSDSRLLLASLQTDHPLEPVNVAGKDLQKFKMDGDGNPVGFLIQEDPVVAVAFSNVEDEDLIEGVVGSITVSE
ncbi:hypothetical protein K8942_01855 [Candidatus Peribacteria bacterium]|nr:MAG: hypothetical protein K8942_01855 [Candidatus Peribacteria bacterium]